MAKEYKDEKGRTWYVHTTPGFREGLENQILTKDKVWKGQQPVDLKAGYEVVGLDKRPMIRKERSAAEQKKVDQEKAEAKARRGQKRKEAKEAQSKHDAEVAERTTQKLLKHPPKAFKAEFYKLHPVSDKQVAAKATKKAKLELRAKELLEKANKL